MRKKFLSLAVVFVFAFTANQVKAQYYCFWVSNQSSQTFDELKVRPSEAGGAFSKDLLPEDYIESGKHFWVKTGNDKDELWDIQITNLDGKPLLFTYKDVDGVLHRDQKFITVSAKDLHTLVIDEDEEGHLTFSYYEEDEMTYGHPCDN